MENELEKAREIFLTGVDEEDRTHNLEVLREWETGILESKALAEWQQHDISKRITAKAKETYREATLILSENRSLTQQDRERLWAQQDAMKSLLSLIAKDPSQELESIRADIRRNIDATN